MFVAQIQKLNDDLVITIPTDEAERLNLQDGQFVEVLLTPIEAHPDLAPDLQDALDWCWERLEPALEYLKDR